MKKIISMAVAAVMSLTAAGMSAMAVDNTPSVYVNNAKVIFADQDAVIVGDRTLVPARGVFQAMDATVEWKAEERTVQIDSDNNMTRIYLKIDSPVMEVYKFKSMFDSDKREVTLDVAPQIMNDRTMVPLRAISEAMSCTVDWEPDTYAVKIKTADADAVNRTTLSLSASADTVQAGETVDIFVNLANFPSNKCVKAVTALVSYSSEDFEFTGSDLYYDNKVIDSMISNANPAYEENAVKVVMITTDPSITSDGTVAKLTFTAKTDAEAEFSLVQSYDTLRGFNTNLSISNPDGTLVKDFGSDLLVNTSPVIINAGK